MQSSLLGVTREVNASGTSYFARTPTGLLIDQRAPSGRYNPLYDGQGDIIGLVNTSGKVERTFRYGPYGENTKSEGTQTIPYPFGFKGGYRMPGGNKGEGNVTNGLYHFGARYYDPTTGRWTQQDPRDQIGSATQGDRYPYAGDNPTDSSDPSGNALFLVEELRSALASSYEHTVDADPVCRSYTQCMGPLVVAHDGYECFDTDECQSFSQDLSEEIPGRE